MKKIVSLLTAFILIFTAFTFSANAASSAVISFSKNTVNVGDTVSVTVTINPGKKMTGVEFVLNYNEEVLKYKTGSAVGGAGSLKVVESPSGETKFSTSLTFTAIKTGTCNISVNECIWTDFNADEKKFGGASANITVKDKALSGDARLKSLYLGDAKLSPAFAMAKTSYKSEVLYEKTKVNVYATVYDKDAKVTSVSGNNNLKVGKNTVTVVVQAANGTQKKYTITVTRLKQGEKIGGEKEEKEEEQDTSLQTTVAGTTYTVATEIPKKYQIFSGFEVADAEFNGKKIQVLTDANQTYKIYYLKSADSEELVPYIFDNELEEFEKLKYLTVDKNTYIFSKIPTEFVTPSNLYASNVEIKDFSVECLADSNSNMSDFYYVYCFTNGNFGLYRYDNLECTLQRYPDFELTTVVQPEVKDNFVSRFNSLSTNGKIIIVCLFVAIIGVLALIILLIVYLFNKTNKKLDIIPLDYDDDFDDVEVVTSDSKEE